MNDQIADTLWLKAHDMSLEITKNHEGGVPSMKLITDTFAELIVKECIRIPYDMWDKAELNADAAAKIELRIKEHFGISE